MLFQRSTFTQPKHRLPCQRRTVRMCSECYDLVHGIKANHVAFGIFNQGNKSMLPNRHLGFDDFSAMQRGAPSLFGAIHTGEIDQSASSRRMAFHANQSPRRAAALHRRRKSPHFYAWKNWLHPGFSWLLTRLGIPPHKTLWHGTCLERKSQTKPQD